MKWIKIGKTHQDKYPDDHSKEVEFTVIENGKSIKTWRGRSVIMTDEYLKRIEPTHWRYVC